MPVKVHQQIIKQVLELYKVLPQVKQILPAESGYRNTIFPIQLLDGTKLALIFFKTEPDIINKIKSSNAISNTLAQQCWPTRKNIKQNHYSVVKLATHQNQYYCGLYNYLAGSTINWENYSKKHIKLLGQVLGFLHQDLREIVDHDSLLHSNEILNIESNINLMSNYFDQNGVKKSMLKKLKLTVNTQTFVQFDRFVTQLKKTPNQQPLHLDFVRSNILFDYYPLTFFQKNPNQVKFALNVYQKQPKLSYLTISGVLDFEKIAWGPPVLDLARTLAFLLIDCKYKKPHQVWKYFLNSGYQKRAQQLLPCSTQLKQALQYYLYYDFYKFLCHNPYESLPFNEHFVRTKNILLKNRLIFSHN